MPTLPADTNQMMEVWPDLSPAERVAAFRSLDRGIADDFFLELPTRDQAELVLALPQGERRLWLRLLPPDDAADLIQSVNDADDRRQLLDQLDARTRTDVAGLMAYAEDAAGGLMNPRFARVRPDMTVDEAIAYLRRHARQVETIYYAYALDSEQHLQGVISFRSLFSADPSTTIREVMKTDVATVAEDADQEAVARLFSELHVLALPVVDREGGMVGIITVDDIVDVVQEEAGEDIQKIGGNEALDEPYLRIAFARMIRKRGGWLAALFLGEMLTATAMGFFEHEIAQAVVLALFIPLIISSGGNSGSQAATLVIRAMAVGEVRLRDWWRVIRRELGSGLVLGAMLGAIGMTRILVWQAVAKPYGEHYMLLALTVGFSLVGVVLFGTIAGSMLPFILRRLGVDPASASAPFVATLVDVTGLVIYFTMASIILRGTLL